MKDSSEEDKGTPRPIQEEKVHHFSDEEWQEVLRRKGAKHIHGKMEGAVVILNPHPELVRKLREYKLRRSSQLNSQKEDQEPSLPLDEKYLGKRYPGTERQRKLLLQDLQGWLDDPKLGPEWVRRNRNRLLWEAEIVVKETLE